ncbi:uncharacterized protein PG986_003947 [Apiospora aurea]|uniref:Uncharacterized protein n=1 Tax=Apiospora aurea TaxID=335848 RepID=A0ABR1QLG2_9PEZI
MSLSVNAEFIRTFHAHPKRSSSPAILMHFIHHALMVRRPRNIRELLRRRQRRGRSTAPHIRHSRHRGRRPTRGILDLLPAVGSRDVGELVGYRPADMCGGRNRAQGRLVLVFPGRRGTSAGGRRRRHRPGMRRRRRLVIIDEVAVGCVLVAASGTCHRRGRGSLLAAVSHDPPDQEADQGASDDWSRHSSGDPGLGRRRGGSGSWYVCVPARLGARRRRGRARSAARAAAGVVVVASVVLVEDDELVAGTESS